MQTAACMKKRHLFDAFQLTSHRIQRAFEKDSEKMTGISHFKAVQIDSVGHAVAGEQRLRSFDLKVRTKKRIVVGPFEWLEFQAA